MTQCLNVMAEEIFINVVLSFQFIQTIYVPNEGINYFNLLSIQYFQGVNSYFLLNSEKISEVGE